MKNIIRIETSKGGKTIVNARALWVGLESKKDFSNWIKAKLLPNFDINKDYTIIQYDISGNIIQLAQKVESEDQSVRPHKIDYPITLDTAKHIALMENTACTFGNLEDADKKFDYLSNH